MDKLTKEQLGEALQIHNPECEVERRVHEAAQRLYDNWDALVALHEAGEKATQGEWRSVITDLDAVPSDNMFFVDNYTGAIWDENGLGCSLNTDYIATAANTRPAIRNLIGEDGD